MPIKKFGYDSDIIPQKYGNFNKKLFLDEKIAKKHQKIYEILLNIQNLQFVHKKPQNTLASYKNICYNECVNINCAHFNVKNK